MGGGPSSLNLPISDCLFMCVGGPTTPGSLNMPFKLHPSPFSPATYPLHPRPVLCLSFPTGVSAPPCPTGKSDAAHFQEAWSRPWQGVLSCAQTRPGSGISELTWSTPPPSSEDRAATVRQAEP